MKSPSSKNKTKNKQKTFRSYNSQWHNSLTHFQAVDLRSAARDDSSLHKGHWFLERLTRFDCLFTAGFHLSFYQGFPLLVCAPHSLCSACWSTSPRPLAPARQYRVIAGSILTTLSSSSFCIVVNPLPDLKI